MLLCNLCSLQFHEKRFPVSVIGGSAADVLGCELGEDSKFRNHHKHRTMIERMQAQQGYEDDIAQRGDIPILQTENCDGNLISFISFNFLNILHYCNLIRFPELMVKSINDLIEVIRQLKAEVMSQRNDIQILRTTMNNCVGCKEPAQPRMTCASGCCYPGD